MRHGAHESSCATFVHACVHRLCSVTYTMADVHVHGMYSGIVSA